MFIYVFMYICMYIYICIYIYMYVYMYIYMDIHIRIHINSIYICVYSHVCHNSLICSTQRILSSSSDRFRRQFLHTLTQPHTLSCTHAPYKIVS